MSAAFHAPAAERERAVLLTPAVRRLVRDMALRELRCIYRARVLCRGGCRKCGPDSSCPVGAAIEPELRRLVEELGR